MKWLAGWQPTKRARCPAPARAENAASAIPYRVSFSSALVVTPAYEQRVKADIPPLQAMQVNVLESGRTAGGSQQVRGTPAHGLQTKVQHLVGCCPIARVSMGLIVLGGEKTVISTPTIVIARSSQALTIDCRASLGIFSGTS